MAGVDVPMDVADMEQQQADKFLRYVACITLNGFGGVDNISA